MMQTSCFVLTVAKEEVNYVAAAIKLYEAAFSRGYARAAYYLGEISDGHLR